MTDLLRRPVTRAPTPETPVRPPLALGAAIVGAAAPLVAVLGLWVVGLVGWFAADGGSHGTTRSVLRVGADAWLLAHGASLDVGNAVVTASPLGLTLLCGYLTYRLARQAAARCLVEDLRAVALGVVVLSGVYALVALVVAALASAPRAEPGFASSFFGGALVGAVAGGAGLLRGAGRAGELRRMVPVPALAVGYAAGAVLVLLVSAGAVLTAVSLTFHGSAATQVVDTLDVDVTGGVMSLVLLAGIAPNVALLAGSYLLGPGFAFGADTIVSPAEVTLGPVPSVPVLAALPNDGWAPGWTVAFLAVPVLVGVGAGYLAGRALPTTAWQSGAVRGLGGGLLGSLAVTIATAYAGGAVGPGRMSEIGAATFGVLLAAVISVGPGAALGGVLAVWWARRHHLAEGQHAPPPAAADPDSAGDENTQAIDLPADLSPDSSDLSSDFSTEETVRLRLPPTR